MANKKRTASQARKDKAALKRLQKSGLFRGKIDLRKAPTKTQLKRIAELKAKRQPLPPRQKTPGATISRKRISKAQLEKDGADKAGAKLTTYALPFLRRGESEPEWRRFTREQLKKFLAEYKGDDTEGAAEWRSYAVRETWTFKTKTERAGFRKETDLYFSGVRISEPQGGITQRRKPNKKAHRGKRKGKK